MLPFKMDYDTVPDDLNPTRNFPYPLHRLVRAPRAQVLHGRQPARQRGTRCRHWTSLIKHAMSLARHRKRLGHVRRGLCNICKVARDDACEAINRHAHEARQCSVGREGDGAESASCISQR